MMEEARLISDVFRGTDADLTGGTTCVLSGEGAPRRISPDGLWLTPGGLGFDCGTAKASSASGLPDGFSCRVGDVTRSKSNLVPCSCRIEN